MANNENLKPFKKGYDPRRWVQGRSKLSPEQKEGERILLAVIWEELSREFDPANNMKPLETPETIDALRLMVRTWIKKKPELIAERIAGKVTDRVDVTTGGEKITGEDDTRAEILRKLDSIATATGAGKVSKQSDE